MIVDAFIFYNEFELLDIRLEELYPVVDKFVIVESNHKLSGKSKPLFFLENQHKYSKYLDKIIRVTSPDLHLSERGLDTKMSFENEINQREFIFEVIKDFPDDSIIMISDLDEIPSRESIESLKKSNLPVAFSQDFFYYDYTSYKGKWTGTKAFLKSSLVSKTQIQEARNALTVERAISQGYNIIESGWHLSYFLGIDGIRDKIKSFAHQEHNNKEILDNIEKAILEKKDLFNRSWEKITYKPYSENLPKLIKSKVENEYKDDVVLAIATHRRKYLDPLLRSLENLPYQKIIIVDQKLVGSNLSQVWEIAKSTGKRYVVLMDDDIEVLEKDLIWRSINIMRLKNWAISGPHETYNSNYELGKHLLTVRDKTWLPGYLLVIDTEMIGNYIFDTKLNDNQDHVDLDMCMYAHSLGYKVGVVDRVIIHNTDNHTPESKLKMIKDGHSQYFMAHDNLLRKWSMESTIVPGKSVYNATYVKAENVYSALT